MIEKIVAFSIRCCLNIIYCMHLFQFKACLLLLLLLLFFSIYDEVCSMPSYTCVASRWLQSAATRCCMLLSYYKKTCTEEVCFLITSDVCIQITGRRQPYERCFEFVEMHLQIKHFEITTPCVPQLIVSFSVSIYFN